MKMATKNPLPALKNAQRLVNTLIGESKTKVDRSRLQPMIVPYTSTAQWVQIPIGHYYKNAFAFKQIVWATIITAPLWLWITSKGENSC